MTGFGIEGIAAISICLVVAWPLARRLAERAIWRRNSRKAGAAALALLGYAALIFTLAVMAPGALPVLAVIAACGIGFYFWIMSSGFGSRRGWPPGSLAPVAPARAADRTYLMQLFRRHGPVFKILSRTQPTACIVGHGAAMEMMSSQADCLAAVPAAYNRHIPGSFLRYMRGADHTEYRRKFQAALAPDLVRSNEAGLRAILREGFAHWQGPVDPAVTSLLLSIMARLFLGLMPDDPRAARLRDAYGKLAVNDQKTAGTDKAARGVAEAEAIFAEIARDPARQGGTDTVLGAVLDVEPKAIDDPTLRRNLIYMLETGHRDVAGLLVWVLKILADNPAWAGRLRAELATAGKVATDGKGRSLADRIILESLRMERSEYLIRRAAKDVRAGGFTIPAGWRIRIGIREWHRANPAFDQPEVFNPDRFLDQSIERADYAPFGLDHHRCLGQKIATDISRLFLEEMFGGYSDEVTGDGPIEFGGSHWQPSRRFQLRLTPNEAVIAAQ